MNRRAMAGKFLKFFAALASVWIAFYLLYTAFPYARAGADLVGERKEQWLQAAPVFAPAPTQAVRVAVFGNSKALSGFVPSLFDQMAGGRVYSVNCGFPGRSPLLPMLRAMIRQGQVPTHVLALQPWGGDARNHPGWWTHDENAVRRTVFPFKDFPRDTFLFALRSRTRGGMASYYGRNRAAVEEMLGQRGYYFIEGQSHSASHRLPGEFRLESDRPDEVYDRRVAVEAGEFRELLSLLEEARIQLILVPSYFRRGEYAEPAGEGLEPLRWVPSF